MTETGLHASVSKTEEEREGKSLLGKECYLQGSPSPLFSLAHCLAAGQ